MEVNTVLNKSEIMPEVCKITGHTGVKSKDIETVSSTEDDLNILESYFGEAVSAIADVISRQGYLLNETSDASTFCFTLPVNWAKNVKSALEKAIRQYAVNYICMQWFNLVKKDEVKYYGEVCDSLSFSIKKYLLEREKPKRNL